MFPKFTGHRSGRPYRYFQQPAGAIVLIVVLTAIAIVQCKRFRDLVEEPIGCDWFGYLRQADLIRDRGVLDGLSTEISDETTRYLIGKGRDVAGASWRWIVAAAPHCHNYKESTDRIVLQYPPGTGYVLSMLPKGQQARMAAALCISILILILARLALRQRNPAAVLPLLLLGIFLLHGMAYYSYSWSIPPTIAVIVLLALATLRYCAADKASQRLIYAAGIGLMLGLAANIRVANLLVGSGLVLVLGLDFILDPQRRKLTEGALMACFFLLGALPVLLANWINAGSPLASTYSPLDATKPTLSGEVLSQSLRYYVFDWPTAALQIAAAAVVAAAVCVFARRSSHAAARLAATIALTSLVSGTLFFLAHIPWANYYLFPFAAFAAATATFCIVWCMPGESGTAASARAKAAVAAILCGCAGLIAFMFWGKVSIYTANSEQLPEIAPDAIVWADLRSGFAPYYLHRQAAVLPFVPPTFRGPLVRSIWQDGRPQIFLLDSPTMERAVRDLPQNELLKSEGQIFGVDALVLPGRSSSSDTR